MSNSSNLLDKEKVIVLAQLQAAGSGLNFSIGGDSTKTYTKKEIVMHVEELDSIGKEFIKTQMEFMRAIKSGELAKVISTSYLGNV